MQMPEIEGPNLNLKWLFYVCNSVYLPNFNLTLLTF
jgi:hypothetical protein